MDAIVLYILLIRLPFITVAVTLAVTMNIPIAVIPITTDRKSKETVNPNISYKFQ